VLIQCITLILFGTHTTHNYSDHFMAPKGIKASKIIQRKSKATVVEWETRKQAQGIRHIPVEVNTSTPWQTSRKDAVRMEMDNLEETLHEMGPPMDIDETSWIDEPVISEQKRVSSPMCPL
jgi:hypothetical protein